MTELSSKLHHWITASAAELKELQLYRYLVFVENSPKREKCIHALRSKEQFSYEEEIDVLEEIAERLQVLIGEIRERRETSSSTC